MFLDTEPSPQPPRINRFLITVLQQFGLQLDSTLSSFPSFYFFSNCDEASQPLLASVSLYSPQTPRERLIYAAHCTSVLILMFFLQQSREFFQVLLNALKSFHMQKLYLSVLSLRGITVPHGLQKVAVVTSPSVVYLNIYPFHSVFPVLSIVNFYTFFFYHFDDQQCLRVTLFLISLIDALNIGMVE